MVTKIIFRTAEKLDTFQQIAPDRSGFWLHFFEPTPSAGAGRGLGFDPGRSQRR